MSSCQIGKKLENAAWFYAAPFEKALDIKDHVAFCKSIPQKLTSKQPFSLIFPMSLFLLCREGNRTANYDEYVDKTNVNVVVD